MRPLTFVTAESCITFLVTFPSPANLPCLYFCDFFPVPRAHRCHHQPVQTALRCAPFLGEGGSV